MADGANAPEQSIRSMIRFPCQPELNGSDVLVKLLPLPASVFNEPFFDDGVKKNPVDSAIPRMSIDTCAEPEIFLHPSAFIFHVSHCGSTLLSQLLTCAEENRVISEPEIINSILLSHVLNQNNPGLTVKRLKTALKLLLQPLHKEKNAFIKFTSWNIFHVPLIMEAFPGVSCCFIRRPTEEVIDSLIKHPNGFAQWHRHGAPILAAHYLNRSFEETALMNDREYFRSMIDLHMKSAEFLPANYIELTFPEWIHNFPASMLSVYQPGQATLEQMRKRLQRDAKNPANTFSSSLDERLSDVNLI